MAKKLSLVALATVLVSFFLPWFSAAGTGLSAGPFMGDLASPALLIYASPALLAAVLGSSLGLKRFGRGLGITVLIFGLAGAAMWFFATSTVMEGGGASMGLGLWLLLAGVLASLGAGVVGTARPETA